MIAPAGVEQSACSLLRAAGGGAATLLLPQTQATTTSQTGLGIVAPTLGGVTVDPVLLQADGTQLQAWLTRGSVEKALNGVTAAAEIERILLRSLLAVGATHYRILAVTVEPFGGHELMYELRIEE